MLGIIFEPRLSWLFKYSINIIDVCGFSVSPRTRVLVLMFILVLELNVFLVNAAMRIFCSRTCNIELRNRNMECGPSIKMNKEFFCLPIGSTSLQYLPLPQTYLITINGKRARGNLA